MALDFTSLQRALQSLSKGYSRSVDEPADEEVRDAVIQRFEYTYELSVKMLKRLLEEIETPIKVERMTYKELIRSGAEKGFLSDPKAWFIYREMRNITSHTYDKSKASAVYEVVPGFIQAVASFLRTACG